jgi:hypothetical protein
MSTWHAESVWITRNYRYRPSSALIRGRLVVASIDHPKGDLRATDVVARAAKKTEVRTSLIASIVNVQSGRLRVVVQFDKLHHCRTAADIDTDNMVSIYLP